PQPNSRWYTGSGIYRNVKLIATNKVYVDHWGTFVTTPEVSKQKAAVELAIDLKNESQLQEVKLLSNILNADQKVVSSQEKIVKLSGQEQLSTKMSFQLESPELWSPDNPYMYSVETKIFDGSRLVDTYHTPLGIREFHFDAEKGFFLNGESTKLHGVCLHHDLGALGAAINVHAIKRKLQILKDMGVNAIRTAHNPPSTEFLKLTDQMGFIVQDEAFDVWKKKKVDYDYH